MAREITPTIRRWELGRRLRQLREQAGVAPLRSATEIGVTTASLSRIENGKQAIKPLYVRLLAVLYGANGDVRDELETLAEEAGRQEWYVALARHSPDWFKQYLGYESIASQIDTWDPELVFGLLQTADYTRAVATAAMMRPDPREVEATVELRRVRQERAAAGEVPINAIVSEAVLRRPIGGRLVMRAQLQRIVELCELPTIDVRVLPFEAGQHSSMASGFVLLSFDQQPEMSTIYIENGRGAVYLESASDLAQYRWKFGRLVDLALPPSRTRDLLVKVISDL